MIEFLKQLPHLEHYGTPIYFIYLILAFLPIFVGLFFKKRFPVYEGLVSLIFIILMLTGSNLKQIYALLFYVVWQILIVYSYKFYRQKADNKWIFYLHSFLSVLPLIFVKVEPAVKNGHQSLSLIHILSLALIPLFFLASMLSVPEPLMVRSPLEKMTASASSSLFELESDKVLVVPSARVR